MALANLDYALTEDIDWRDEWVEAAHPRVPKGGEGGGQFTSGGAGGAPLPKPEGLSSPLAHTAYEMATTGGFTAQEIADYGDGLVLQGQIKPNSKIAVYVAELANAKEQQGSGAPAPSQTEIPHHAGMIKASVSAETAYLLAMQPNKTAADIQNYFDAVLASGDMWPNSPAAQYIQQIIKAKKAQQTAHGTKAAEPVDIQAEPTKLTSFTPALTPKQQGEYAAGTATTELAQAAADPVKLAKFGEQSHAIGQSLNTPAALAGAAVQDAKISIATWTTPGPTGFHMITNHLMGKATSEKAAYHADMIQKAILSNSIPESVNAYRGVKGDMFQEIQTKQPGDSWTIKKFQATTIDPRKATYYAKGGKGGAMIHYVLPAGQKALYVSDPKLNAWEGEHELLLPASSTIKLIGTSTVDLPEYDYTGKQVGPGGPVTIYHVEMMQPGSPEFEAAHPRGEGGKFVAKPGSEVLQAEEEKFDGGAFDPDPESAHAEQLPPPPHNLPLGTIMDNDATATAKAMYESVKNGDYNGKAALLDQDIEAMVSEGDIDNSSAQYAYLQDLLAAHKANEGLIDVNTQLATGNPIIPVPPEYSAESDDFYMKVKQGFTAAVNLQAYLNQSDMEGANKAWAEKLIAQVEAQEVAAQTAAMAPPLTIPDVPPYTGKYAKNIHVWATAGKSSKDILEYYHSKLANGELDPDTDKNEIAYIEEVLAVLKAKQSGATPPATTVPAPPAVIANMKHAKQVHEWAGQGISSYWLGKKIAQWESDGSLDKWDSDYHYVQSVHKALQAKEQASVGTGKSGLPPPSAPASKAAEPAAYPAPFLPIEMPKPNLNNAPSAEHAYEQVTRKDGKDVAWLKKYIEKSLKDTHSDEHQEGVVVEGSEEHKYLQKLLRTLQQQKYEAQNAAQQPELFAPSAVAAPPPPPPKPKLGTGNPSDYGRSYSSSVSPVRAVYETTNARRLGIGEDARTSAVRVSGADEPEAEKACPSLKRTWWKKQDTEIRDSCREFLSGSKGINGALLGDAASSVYGSGPGYIAHAENIDAAFEDDAAVVKQDIRGFRGTKLDSKVIAQLKQALADGKPALWERRGFTSLSLADSVHSSFEAEVYLNVTVRKGTRALGLFGLGRDSGYERENELLLRAGRPLEVYAVHEHEDGKHTVFAYTQN